MVSDQRCLLHCYRLALRRQPGDVSLGIRSRLVSTDADVAGLLAAAFLLGECQRVAQLFRGLPGLVVDAVGSMDAHGEVLEQGVAPNQALQPQPLSTLLPLTWRQR